MTADQFLFEDWNGDKLRVIPDAKDVRIAITDTDDYCVSVDIPIGDVRKVTAEMRAMAGLPSRWTSLRERIADEIAVYDDAINGYLSAREGAAAAIVEEKREVARAILCLMDEIEAGQ